MVVEGTPHAVETYAPDVRREGLALALSGGGYRAALFHLGSLRRLNELGVLSQIDTVSSVSGGSILSAFLAEKIRVWPDKESVLPDWEERIARPFKRLMGKNIRTSPVVKRLLPWNWLDDQTAVETLAQTYAREITKLQLTDLPDRPRYIFCATDLPYAVNWIFERRQVGDYQAGYIRPAPAWPVSRAVAASSCFPPVFGPLVLGLEPSQLQDGKAKAGPKRDAIVRSLRLSDGGVYDNLGLEPVWKDHATLLVSDGGSTFDASPDSGFLWQLQQYSAVVSRQATAARKRWLISNYMQKQLAGTYWGIGSAAANYGFDGGYSEDLVDEVIAEVRTDLDAFTDAEMAVLENHGYVMAEAAISRHAPQLIKNQAPFLPPNREWMAEDKARDGLKDSAKRKIVGRGLPFRLF